MTISCFPPRAVSSTAPVDRIADQSQSPAVELSVVIPRFNERGNIVPLIRHLRTALHGIDWAVIFVDDDSQDKTLRIVRDLSPRDRLLFYALLCSVGIMAGVGVSSLFYAQQPKWWLDGLAGAIIGAGWNYVTSSMITWRNAR